MNALKKLTAGAVVISVALSSSLAVAKDILTSVPVTYMLATQLTKHTDIQTTYLPPKRYGVDRLENWYATKGNEVANVAGKDATVAITISAVWKQDPTYVYARQGNINLIEIDASQAITPKAQGVASLTLQSGETSKYVWLNPTNIIRMAAIVSDDLQRIFPEHQSTIALNQQKFMRLVKQLINQQQSVLFEKEIDSVVLLSESLEDFVSGNQLFVIERKFKPEFDWDEDDKQEIKCLFEQDDTVWLVTDRKPSAKLLELVPEERVLIIDAIDRWGSAGIDAQLPLRRWEI